MTETTISWLKMSNLNQNSVVLTISTIWSRNLRVVQLSFWYEWLKMPFRKNWLAYAAFLFSFWPIISKKNVHTKNSNGMETNWNMISTFIIISVILLEYIWIHFWFYIVENPIPCTFHRNFIKMDAQIKHTHIQIYIDASHVDWISS